MSHSLDERIRAAFHELEFTLPIEDLARRAARRSRRTIMALSVTSLVVAVSGIAMLRPLPVAAYWSTVSSPADPELVRAAPELCAYSRDVVELGPLPPLLFVDQRGDGAMAFFGSAQSLGNCFLMSEDGEWKVPAEPPFPWLVVAGLYDQERGISAVRLVSSDGEVAWGATANPGYFGIWWPEEFTTTGRIEFLNPAGTVVDCWPVDVNPTAEEGELRTVDATVHGCGE